MTRKSIVIMVFAAAAAVFLTATWFVTNQKLPANTAVPKQQNSDKLIRPYSPILGSENAPVTIVEFFDPACEACRAFHPILKEILSQHGESVRIVIRYAAFHGKASEEAIRVLEAAKMQNKFEPVLEALLRDQPLWAAHGAAQPELIPQIASSAGLDLAAAKTQMLSPSITGILNQDRSDVESLGVSQTPTFFVNGKPLDPFGPDELRALVAAEVASTGS